MATYLAQRIAGSDTGWRVTNEDTGRGHVVFCHVNNNTAEAALELAMQAESKAGPEQDPT